MNLYITRDEIKTMLGISGSSNDARIDMFNEMATAEVNDFLSVESLALHKVTNERHDARGRVFYLRDVHVRAIGSIYDDDSEYTQDEVFDIDNYVLRLEKSLYQGDRKAFITYAAGWNAGGFTTLSITDYSSIASAETLEFDLDGGGADVTLTEGTDWNAVTDNPTTAQSIADASTTMRVSAVPMTACERLRSVRLFTLWIRSHNVKRSQSRSELATTVCPSPTRLSTVLISLNLFGKLWQALSPQNWHETEREVTSNDTKSEQKR